MFCRVPLQDIPYIDIKLRGYESWHVPRPLDCQNVQISCVLKHGRNIMIPRAKVELLLVTGVTGEANIASFLSDIPPVS